MDIFRVLDRSLPLIPAYIQRMMAESDDCGCCCLWSLSRRFIKNEKTPCVHRYAPRSYSQRVNDQQVSILLRISLPDT